ncbi:signal peptidase I [Arthrobacter crystallopoietes BAB-32]|uniref:Signal peptidase I n=1 Tax=Arthrobacter crystallopoietes BAB-32 TaxID=1246476 RepID=N1VC28_9MICC|nr:signal peptidase I [Arthrobacter crystallopoietes]EMY35828.1 signal peptidase I [Arthrobacter crystallopoietes BAB-32]
MEKAADKRRNPALAWLKEIAIIVAVALLLSFLIKTFLFRAFYIPSTSMEDTLEVNDRIFVNLLVPEPIGLQRGDVVVFRDDLGWLPPNGQADDGGNWFQQALTFVGLLPDSSQQHLVKRVIGIGGDRVVCCDADGRITVNGHALSEPYLHPESVNESQPFDVVVPEGKIWVMGDNRNHSADSREHREEASGGFIDLEAVEGKAAVIAWPLDRMAVLGNYPEVFDAVPPAGSGGPAPESAPAGRTEQESGQ